MSPWRCTWQQSFIHVLSSKLTSCTHNQHARNYFLVNCRSPAKSNSDWHTADSLHDDKGKFFRLTLVGGNRLYRPLNIYAETLTPRDLEVDYHTPLSKNHWCSPTLNAHQYRLEQDISREKSNNHGDELRLDNAMSTTQPDYRTKSSLSNRGRYMPNLSQHGKMRNYNFEKPSTMWQEHPSIENPTAAYGEDNNVSKVSHHLRLGNHSGAHGSPQEQCLQLKDAIHFVNEVTGDRLPSAHWHTIGWMDTCAPVTC